MNEFLDTFGDCMAEAVGIVGESLFQIAGQEFVGTVDLFDAEKTLLGGTEGPGGVVGTYSGNIVAVLRQFVGKFPEPLERSLFGLLVDVDGRRLRIGRAAVDEISVTLRLENPNKK